MLLLYYISVAVQPRNKFDDLGMFSNKIKDYCRQVNIVDEHHPAPTFTPPELPKKVHVRGSASGNFFYLLQSTHSISNNS